MALQVGFIGGGQMARALVQGIVGAGVISVEDLCVSEPSDEAWDGFVKCVPGVARAADNRDLAARSDVIWLAVKPHIVARVAQQIGGQVSSKLLVSIAAGITLEQLRSMFSTQRLIRVMPNTPCLIGRGAAGFAAGAEATAADGELTAGMLRAVGVAERVDERLLDAVTGLSGSGPAYVFTVIEALADGGVLMGLPRATARVLARETVLGAATLLASSELHPAQLRDQVASPGGTTIAGIEALESAGLRSALIAAVRAATERSRELSREFGEPPPTAK